MTSNSMSVVRHRAARPTVARIFLFALAVSLAIQAPSAVWRSARRIRQAWELRSESFLDSRRRAFGAEYTDGIEAIRRSIPLGQEYLLVRDDDPEEEADLWVRYDLAPRRAVFLGEMKGPWRRRLRELHSESGSPFLVVASGGARAPRLLEAAPFLDRSTSLRTPGDGVVASLRPDEGRPARFRLFIER